MGMCRYVPRKAELVHFRSTGLTVAIPRKMPLPLHRPAWVRVDGPWSRHSTTHDPAGSFPPPPGAERRPDGSPPQPRGGGVRARGHAALPGRHRLGHGDLQGRGLLQASHGHIFEAITSLFGQGEPADWVTVTEELRRRELLEIDRRHVGLRHPPGQHPLDRQRRVLRQDRRGARPAAPAGGGGRRRSPSWATAVPEDVSEVLDRAESLVFDVAQRRVVDSMTPLRGPARGHPRPPRAAVQPERVGHRTGHRLHRPRRAAGRPAAVQPGRGGGPARHGEDRLRPRAWWPTPGSSSRSRSSSSRSR